MRARGRPSGRAGDQGLPSPLTRGEAPVALTRRQRRLREEHDFDFRDLRALFVNCTLTPSPQRAHAERL